MIAPFVVPLSFIRKAGYTIDVETDCWNWSGTKSPFGHGRMTWQGKRKVAHRVYWEYYHGIAVKPNHVLHHLCENPACVNPEHLIEITQRDHKGLYHPSYKRKFTDGDVTNIRWLHAHGWPRRWILEFYPGTAPSTITRLVNRTTYR